MEGKEHARQKVAVPRVDFGFLFISPYLWS